MNQELINYIKENQSKGLSKEQITRSLLAAGWQQKDIDAAFLQLDVPLSSLPPFQINPQISENLRKTKRAQAVNSQDLSAKIKLAPLDWKTSAWFLAICLAGSFLIFHTVHLIRSIQIGYPPALYFKNLFQIYICWASLSCFLIGIISLGILFVPGLLLFALLSNRLQFAKVGILIMVAQVLERHFLYSYLIPTTFAGWKYVIISDLFDLSIILIPVLILLISQFFFKNKPAQKFILKGVLVFLLVIFSFKIIFLLTFTKYYHLPRSLTQKLLLEEIKDIKKDYKKNTKTINW